MLLIKDDDMIWSYNIAIKHYKTEQSPFHEEKMILKWNKNKWAAFILSAISDFGNS